MTLDSIRFLNTSCLYHLPDLRLYPPSPRTQMPGILSLAPELIQQISQELGQSKKDLRATCAQLNFAIEPQALAHLVVNLDRYRLDAGISLLEALASQSSHASEYTRTLEIRALAPSYDPKYQGARWIFHADGSSEREAEPEPGPEVRLAESRMQEALAPALRSLKNLRTFIWTMNDRDPVWTRPTVIDSLASLPSLTEFQLKLSYNSAGNLQLNRLSGLHKLIVSGTCDNYRENVSKRLGELIAHSPQLEHLDLHNVQFFADEKQPTLHDLLEKVPRNRPLRLKHLGLEGWCTRLDATTLPHLTSLGSFKLLHNLVAKSHPKPSQQLCETCSTNDEIWNTLRKNGVVLSGLVTDLVTDGLLDYLSSYTGLESLKFTYATSSTWQESDRLADKFYHNVLPRHVDSLAQLYIKPGFEGRWCFSQEIIPILSRCRKLLELTIGIKSNEVLGDHTKANALAYDAVAELLAASERLAPLTYLSILPANVEANRGARCGNPAMRHFNRAREMIRKSICAYTPIGPSRGSPVTNVGTQVFHALPDKTMGGAVRYTLTESCGSEYTWW